MLVPIGALATLVALSPLAHGMTVSEDFMISRRTNAVLSAVDDWDVIDAFKAAGHPDATPRQTWQDENGTTYQTLWDFDHQEWNNMRGKLLADIAEKRSLDPALLLPRQANKHPAFYCEGDTTSPYAYTETLSSVTGIICGFFAYGVGAAGRIQVIERYHLQDIGGNALKVTFKYGWQAISFASATTCSNAIQYGIQNACTAQKHGKKATQNEQTDYYHPVTGKVTDVTSVSMKRI